MAPHRVVVIGSGFGGLFGTQALKRRKDVEVTLIAKTTHHLFQPLLYQVATGILSEGAISPSTREILSGQKNARVILGTVTDIDLDAKTVTSEVLGRESVTEFDTLLVAAGAGQSYFGNDQFAEYAPGMKSIDDALELRGRIFGAFEWAELATAPAERDRYLTFVVVGAGPTGVEMAGQIAELAHRTLKRDFRAIDTRQARIVLVDAAPQVLPSFGDRLGGAARDRLTRMGVEVELATKVVGVDATGINIEKADGTHARIEAATKVWAAGVQGSELGAMLAEQSDAELDRAGRVKVNPDLTLPGRPDVYVVGDMMALDNLPGVAQVAIQGARYAAKHLKARLDGKSDPAPFSYFDKGSMATISRFSAVASVGKLRFSGFLAWLLWLGIHIVYLIGFKQRVTTLLHWAVSFIGRGRGERTVTAQQILARNIINAMAPEDLPKLPIVEADHVPAPAGDPAATTQEPQAERAS
ncbi:NAD(P)/FAD-dependent oxidoreductase [Knoellia subterranea]|uniref:NADH:ubiquinone reductase (non-electrogenic) n=1 Tax=Knoellia subterranea KCTC 19937 TaxID=1385521 RepID=A0A0A0JTH0_9MICO|nr:NAD(P)/FAD-dependent oxidoreductase [Knoellia subterranea]KGN39372.1 NADH dehydrogenase [Knoellia subterranea KCTC 19937]